MATSQPYVIQGPLTAEIANVRSPVRQFLDELCADGLRHVQRRYREEASGLAVPGAPRSEANPGTVGTAADWLLRFLVDPEPELDLVMMGAMACARVGVRVLPALAEVVGALGMSLPSRPAEHVRVFAGPTAGNGADAVVLAQSCWVFALITEAYRGGPMVAAAGPLGQFRGAGVTEMTCLAWRRGWARPARRVPARVQRHTDTPACRANRNMGGRPDVHRLGDDQG